MTKAVRIIVIGLCITLVFAILMAVVMLAGLSAGYLVTYLFPAMNLNSAAIAGVLAFGVVVYCVVQFMRLIATIQLRTQYEDDKDDEDIDSELILEEQVEAMADRVSEAVMMKMGSWRDRRSASSRKRR